MTQKVVKGFKFVRVKNGVMRTVLTHAPDQRYNLHKKSFPLSGDGPLAMFETVKDARECAGKCMWAVPGSYDPSRRERGKLTLYEATGKKSKYSLLWAGRHALASFDFPDGTICVDFVTLKKEVRCK